MRHPSIDLLRGLAVLAMIFVHAGKAFLDDEQHWAMGWWVYVPEPVIPATFLAVSGYAIALVHAGGRLPPLGQLARRTAQLFVIAYVMFVFGYGLRWPDTLVTPGILAVIGVVGLLLSVLLRRPRPALWIGGGLAAAFATYVVFDREQIRILGLNWGNESLMQNLCYGLVGALIARWHLARGERVRVPQAIAAAAMAAVIAGVLATTPAAGGLPATSKSDVLSDTPLNALFYGEPGRGWLRRNFEGRHLGHQIAHALWDEQVPRIRMRFWVARPPLVAFLCATVGLLLVAGKPLLERVLARPGPARLTRWLQIVGRHSLWIYAAHLAVIGLLTIPFGHHGMAPAGTLSWFVVVTAGSTGLAYALEARKRRPAPEAAPAPAAAPEGPRRKRKKR